MKKKLLTILLIGIMVFALASCGGILGKWRLVEVTAGDITMTEDDVNDMGIDAGFVKINKSGSCQLNILGDEYEGTWTQAEDGALTINYGDDLSATGTIDGKTMSLTDVNGSEYTLKK